MLALHMLKVLQNRVHLRSRNLLKFWEISANISETVQDRHIVTIERLIGNHMCPIEWHQYR